MEFYNILVMHISILGYTLFRFYVSLENEYKTTFIDNNIIINDKKYIKFLIKTKLKITFDEQIMLRLFLVKLMYRFMSEDYIHPIWCIIFSSYYFYYEFNIYIKIAKFMNIFIISYFVLFNAPFLLSLLIHCYTEVLMILLTRFLSNNYDIKMIQTNKSRDININTIKKIK